MKISKVASLEMLILGVGSSSGESADEGDGNLGGPPIFEGAARSYLGYGSSGEESSEEGEVTLVGTYIEESMGEETAEGKEETSGRVQGSDEIDLEGEEVDRVVLSPILRRVREEEQGDSSLRVTGEWGSHAEGRMKGTGSAVKTPPGTRGPEGGDGEKDAGRNPDDEGGAVLEEPEGKGEWCQEPLRCDQALFPKGNVRRGDGPWGK